MEAKGRIQLHNFCGFAATLELIAGHFELMGVIKPRTISPSLPRLVHLGLLGNMGCDGFLELETPCGDAALPPVGTPGERPVQEYEMPQLCGLEWRRSYRSRTGQVLW